MRIVLDVQMCILSVKRIPRTRAIGFQEHLGSEGKVKSGGVCALGQLVR